VDSAAIGALLAGVVAAAALILNLIDRVHATRPHLVFVYTGDRELRLANLTKSPALEATFVATLRRADKPELPIVMEVGIVDGHSVRELKDFEPRLKQKLGQGDWSLDGVFAVEYIGAYPRITYRHERRVWLNVKKGTGHTREGSFGTFSVTIEKLGRPRWHWTLGTPRWTSDIPLAPAERQREGKRG
jgi:hypothetical protein